MKSKTHEKSEGVSYVGELRAPTHHLGKHREIPSPPRIPSPLDCDSMASEKQKSLVLRLESSAKARQAGETCSASQVQRFATHSPATKKNHPVFRLKAKEIKLVKSGRTTK